MRANDAPSFGCAVGVAMPSTLERLKPENPTALYRDGARYGVLDAEVTFQDCVLIYRVGSKSGAIDRVLHLRHTLGVSLLGGSKSNHGYIFSR